MKRRIFVQASVLATAATLTGWWRIPLKAQGKVTDLVKTSNGTPVELVNAAIEALGGMKRFISKGDRVVVKPNIGWDRNVAQGANTHPEVVAQIIKLCYDCGASQVQVFDRTCNSAKRCYDNSGIAEAAKKAGAKVSFIMETFFRNKKIPGGELLKSWSFYKPALDADKYINVPVLKHHSLATLTIGFKNIMGIIGGNRGFIHHNFDIKIVDLNTVLRPTLTIVDATRVLRRNGPTGGSLGDVEELNQLIAGIDPVAVDTAASDLFGVDRERLPFLSYAQDRGLGSMSGADSMLEIDLSS